MVNWHKRSFVPVLCTFLLYKCAITDKVKVFEEENLMDNMDAMANVTVKKQKETYSEKLGKQEVADYKKHYFDLENYGGQKEAEDLIIQGFLR